MPEVASLDSYANLSAPTTILDSETQQPIQHDQDDPLDDLALPSSAFNERPGKRSGLQGGKRMKWKNKSKVKTPSGGIW
jgi:hypothetical protein